VKRKRSATRRLSRGAVYLLTFWLALTTGSVALLRFVAPPTSMVMLLEPGPAADIDYRWVDRSGISLPPALAVIASEDQKFLDHHGFDLDEIGDAIGTYRDGGRLRGASTISQQVAKNLFLSNGGGYPRKAVEAYFTLLIESLWPKERILEVYLNIAEFGPGVFGVESAAQRFFGRPAAELTTREAALLAAVLPSPKRFAAADPSPYVLGRRSEIAEQMRLLENRGHYAGLHW
jgi:monofunctional biosynthetic peptidoglycan transglycosylase